MYKDRGIIKWAPFDALIGFNEQIYQMLYEKNKTDKPILTEDKLQQMDITIKEAIQYNHPLQVDYYQKGYIKTIYDHVKKVDMITKELIFISGIRIKISDITELSI